MSKFKQLIDDNIDGLKPFQIGIGDFVEVYKNKNFYAWEQETTLKLHGGDIRDVTKNGKRLFVIPSATQRLKKCLRKTPGLELFQSTWSEGHISVGLTSWMTKTIPPIIWLNTRLWSQNEMTLVYDGESKMHLVAAFLDGKEMFKITETKKGIINFTPTISAFVSKSTSNENFDKGRLVTEMLNEFKAQRELGDFESDYLTPQWMTDNGYDDVLNNLKSHKAVVIITDLDPEVEADVYQILGATGADQVLSQLSMSFVKSEMWGWLYHQHGTPDNTLSKVFDDMIDDNVKTHHYFKSIFDSILMRNLKQGYKEYDVYFYNLFVFAFLEVKNGKLVYNPNFNVKNLLPHFVRWQKNHDNIEFFQSRTNAYKELTPDEKSSLVSTLKEKVMPKLNELLKILGGDTFQGYLRKPNQKGRYHQINKAISTEWKKVTGSLAVSDDIRAKLNLLKEDVGLIITLLMTVRYFVSNEALNVPKASNILDNVLLTFANEYAKYIFGSKTLTLTNNAVGLKEGREYFKKNLTNKSGVQYGSLGQFLALTGKESKLGLDTTAVLTHNFFNEVVKLRLKDEFGSIVDRAKVRRKLESKYDLDGYSISRDFLMINPHGDVYTFDQGDIGHLQVNRDGNTLTEKYFIFEERNKNQVVYRLDDKEQVIYYSLCKIRLDKEIKKASNPLDVERIVELAKCKKTLNWLINYHGIDIDETIEFDETGYIVKEKDAA